MQSGLSHERNVRLSVRPSVCPSVFLSVKRMNCDKTKESCAHILIPHERTFILVFSQKERLVLGRPFLLDILGQTDFVGAKTPIFKRYSLFASQQ